MEEVKAPMVEKGTQNVLVLVDQSVGEAVQ